MTQNMVSILESSLPTLSGAYASIATYVLQHRKDVLDMSTRDLAQVCGVSEATIVRFSRSMGTHGYRDFKIALSASNAIRAQAEIDVADIQPGDSPIDVAKKLTSYTIASLESTGESLDYEQLEHAVDVIDAACVAGNKIYIAGVGATSTVAHALMIKLMRLGISTVYFEDIHLQLESMMNIQAEDVLICFTVLGRSIENEQLVDIARARGCEVIVVSQRGVGGTAEKATCLLLTSCVESGLRLASQTGLIMQMLLVDVLFTSLALRHLDETREGVMRSKRAFVELGHYAR
ncbi:MurR/RpiR family transcriptional regulator [Collinsella sp. zg1085]|uniref:MurR/RpiR family transcriptional regulator n=1 Tax=Collinsella sp. zg1085 TaxID=2844380 RepID=UPI001C0C0FC9|nr:MurR/RpiR family transcriptional regulator [Collinsella sp. zg1085]QWT17298.1 MurR/RpiR family transcriptional regulator [Collinsella sp. zg1085]